MQNKPSITLLWYYKDPVAIAGIQSNNNINVYSKKYFGLPDNRLNHKNIYTHVVLIVYLQY